MFLFGIFAAFFVAAAVLPGPGGLASPPGIIPLLEPTDLKTHPASHPASLYPASRDPNSCDPNSCDPTSRKY